MSIRKILHVRILLIIALIFCFVVIAFSMFNNIFRKDISVARIGNDRITYDEIGVVSAQKKFDPILVKLEGEKLAFAIKQREKMNLSLLIREKFMDKLIKKYGIIVTQQEIDEEFSKRVSNIPEGTMDEIKEITGVLIESLENWHKNPDHEREIYEQKLQDLIEYDVWSMYRNLYDTPDKLNKIKPYKDDIKGLSGAGIVRFLAQEKLRQIAIRDRTVSENEIRQHYNQNNPRILSWSICHFFHTDKNVLYEIMDSLLSGANLERVFTIYNLQKSSDGGFEMELIYSGQHLPFYAESLKKLSEKEISEIYFGLLSAQWKDGKPPSRLSQEKHFYHFIYVKGINREKVATNFEIVKDSIRKEILKDKKEKAWHEWLKKEISQADIEILDKRYEGILEALFQNQLVIIRNARWQNQ